MRFLRHSLLLIALSTTGGCALLQRTSAPAAPVIAPAALDTLAEILRLEDRREFDGRRIELWLADSSALVRRSAVRALGRIGDPTAAPLLVGALTDVDPDVRTAAAFALGEMDDSSGVAVEALTLVAFDVAGPIGMRREAIAALGKVAAVSPRAAQIVATFLEPGCCDPALTAEALLAVWRAPRSADVLDDIRVHLRAPDADLRWRAAYVLYRWADPAAVRDAIAAGGDADHQVRATAARALRAAEVDSAGARAEALAVLTAALADPHPHVRINALRALGTYSDAALVDPIAALLQDPDANVAIMAAQTLPAFGAAAAPALDQTVTNMQLRIPLRGAALGGLARVAPEPALPLVDAWLGSGEWLERWYAAGALGALPWGEVSTRARRLLMDADARLAAAGLQAAAQSADTAAAGQTLFLEGLAHPDPWVRAAAIGGIANRADAADLPVLLQAYERAQRDKAVNDAIIAAVDALGALAAKDVPVSRSFFLRFARSPDPVVRAHVAARLGLGSWGEPFPVDVSRDSSFYRDVVRYLVEPELRAGIRPSVRIQTAAGPIVLELFAADAPLTTHNFLSLARRAYFNGGRWHRVVPNFVLQDGDPRGDGAGGPGYAIRDEINPRRYVRGALGMALSGADTGGSQFFITHSPQPHLDGGYTVFGQIVDGMTVADAVVQDDAILSIDEIPPAK